MSEPLIKGGAILIARKVVESAIWEKPPLYIKVWLYLLTQAQHKPYKGMDRGQVFTSIPDIIEACSWKVGARRERPTKDQIFNILEWLRKPNEGGNESNAKATAITTTKATHGMLVNIDNYGFYQTLSNYESNGESDDENATKPLRKQREADNINKNVKNVQEQQEEKTKKPSSSKRFFADTDIEFKISKYLHEQILTINPNFKTPDLQKWSNYIRLMYEIDERSTEEIREVIRWMYSTADTFWRTNILSTKKFREKFDVLNTKRLASTSIAKTGSGYSKSEKNEQVLREAMEEAQNEQRGNRKIIDVDLLSLPDVRGDEGED